jgi:hypothetical protein
MDWLVLPTRLFIPPHFYPSRFLAVPEMDLLVGVWQMVFYFASSFSPFSPESRYPEDIPSFWL